MSHDLAIIIPAYKPDYFVEAVQSVLNQTNNRFNVYIFDDASSHDLKSLLEKSGLLDQVDYHRFEENLGQVSLTAHWNRCVDSIGAEPWIWLFSDDDLMNPHCVEKFYQAKDQYSGYAAYRFNSRKFNDSGETIRENSFPETFGASEFLNIKLSYQQESYVVEWIFSRLAFRNAGGFPDLPLAWAADDLFWAKIAMQQPVRTIPDAQVHWRYSGKSISSNTNKNAAKTKLEASRQFLDWIREQDEIKKELAPADLPASWYVRQIRSLQNHLSVFDEIDAVRKLSRNEKNVWKYYLRMKKERSKLVGWVKRFLS